jgi:hypothetical protein
MFFGVDLVVASFGGIVSKPVRPEDIKFVLRLSSEVLFAQKIIQGYV